MATLASDLRVATGEQQPFPSSNARWVSYLFENLEAVRPLPPRYFRTTTMLVAPVGILVPYGIHPHIVIQSAR